LGRYPSGILKIDAGTTIPAPAEVAEEDAPAEAETQTRSRSGR
jgi:hypothetical protein